MWASVLLIFILPGVSGTRFSAGPCWGTRSRPRAVATAIHPRQLPAWRLEQEIGRRSAASAANLKPLTRKAWEEYVIAANAQMQERLSPFRPFLLSDKDPGRAAKLRSGEILVSPAGRYIPK